MKSTLFDARHMTIPFTYKGKTYTRLRGIAETKTGKAFFLCIDTEEGYLIRFNVELGNDGRKYCYPVSKYKYCL